MNNPMILSQLNRERLRTNFDAAADNRHTANHFADASSIDLNSAIWADRNILVQRCKYELRNNSYARGMVDSYVNEVIGTGPVLQMQTDNSRFNAEVEAAFSEWWQQCSACGRFSGTMILQTGLKEQMQAGEDIIVFTADPDAGRSEPSLRLMPIAPERLSDPYGADPHGLQDGIQIDPNTGKPLAYHILKSHPGSNLGAYDISGTLIPAQNVLHTFVPQESGQYRGVPHLVPALTLMADLRRYTKAVIAAAEQAANISAVVYTTLGQIDPDQISAMDEIEIARNALLTLPQGWEAKQFDAKQPTGTYKDFKAEIINEIGRCIMMPYIVAAGKAQDYNYASGRLDLQDWWRAVDVIRHFQHVQKLKRIVLRWLAEAALIPGYFRHYTAKLRSQPLARLPFTFNWPGHYHVDPGKEAAAQAQRLASHTTTLAREFAMAGLDWEQELDQRFRELAKLKELADQYGIQLPTAEPQPAEDTKEDDED